MKREQLNRERGLTELGGARRGLVAAALVAASLGFASSGLLAQQPAASSSSSPVGLWKTIDDSTGQAKAFVRIEDRSGVLVGKIERLVLAPGANSAPRCTKCADDRKDQPVIGMIIIDGLRRADASVPEWTGGQILDPSSGTLYRAKVKLIEDGKRLEVRGFIGAPILGRTQVWQRAD